MPDLEPGTTQEKPYENNRNPVPDLKAENSAFDFRALVDAGQEFRKKLKLSKYGRDPKRPVPVFQALHFVVTLRLQSKLQQMHTNIFREGTTTDEELTEIQETLHRYGEPSDLPGL